MDYYKILFFLTIAIQSACNGVVAGVTKNGSLVAGVRHAAIMFAISLILYVMFILPPTLQLTAVSERFTAVPGQSFTVFGTAMSDDTAVVNSIFNVYVENDTYVGITDLSGAYEIEIIAPEEHGEYEGRVTIFYEGQETEALFRFRVT
jgi:hypothetical protein